MSTMSAGLERALKSAVKPVVGDAQDLRTERKATIARLDEAIADWLPAEGEEVKKRLLHERRTLSNLLEAEPLSGKYPRIDCSVLSWTADVEPLTRYGLHARYFSQGTEWIGDEMRGILPLLAPIPIDIGVFRYGVNMVEDSIERRQAKHRVSGTMDKFYPPMAEQYPNTVVIRNGYLRSATFSVVLNAVIPKQTKARIQAAKRDFQRRSWGTLTAENIFILMEVHEWQLDNVSLLHPDPLVVGYKHGSLWLIDHFDETPLEEYIKEFCTS